MFDRRHISSSKHHFTLYEPLSEPCYCYINLVLLKSDFFFLLSNVPYIKIQQRVNLALQGWHSFQQLLHRHGPHRSISSETKEEIVNQQLQDINPEIHTLSINSRLPVYTCDTWSIHRCVWSVLCTLHFNSSAHAVRRAVVSASSTEPSTLWEWAMTHSVFISALCATSKAPYLAKCLAGGGWVHGDSCGFWFSEEN